MDFRLPPENPLTLVMGSVNATGLRSYETRITPQRCDSFKVKLEWTGDVKVYGFSRELDFGSVN